MATKIYTLNDSPDHKLTIQWGFMWKNGEILDNDQLIGNFEGASELRKGKEFTLSNGKQLSVKLQESFWKGTGLDLQVEGKPLKGSINDPHEQIRSTATFIWIIAGLNILMGLVWAFWVKEEKMAGLGMVLLGALIGALGYFFKEYHSKASLLVVIAVVILDIILTIMSKTVPAGMYMKGVLLAYLIRGYIAISKAKIVDLEEKIDEIGTN